jgi:WD40 repeat protein/serine/threonine protein kinase
MGGLYARRGENRQPEKPDFQLRTCGRRWSNTKLLSAATMERNERDTAAPPDQSSGADSSDHESVSAADPRERPVPRSIGRYHILSVLGHGGMGSVYKAEQRHPIRRTVAIKIIKLGLDTREIVARFESERQALARMDHPNIARVLDAGTTDGGNPYFVMEYVPGRPITQFADENKLTIGQRLELFKQVCQAVQHAHTKAIIHRDIKASNILASMHDAQPQVKVIDFGIAKALTSDRLTEATFATSAGMAVGTLEYMSPEQADCSPDIDTRTDVYSLGVLLYELLTGEKPFDRETLPRSDAEIRRVIREVDPPRPSTKLTQSREAKHAASARRAAVEELARALRSELEWIPLKALRKDRNERYDSASQMADDIENYLSGRPLLAAPESAMYRFRKFLVRHKAPVGVAAAFMVMTTLAAIVMSALAAKNHALAISEKHNRETAQLAQQTAEQQRNLADQERVRAESSARAERQQLYAARINLAQQASEAGEMSRLVDLLNSVRPAPGEEDQRGFEWFHLWQTCHAEKQVLQIFGATVRRLALSSDGKILATADDMTVKLWALPEATSIGTLSFGARIYSMAFSPDGKLLAVGGGDEAKPGALRLWNVQEKKASPLVGNAKGAVFAMAFTPDGTSIVGGTAQMQKTGRGTNTYAFNTFAKTSELMIWNLADLKTTGSAEINSPAVRAVRVRNDGKAVAIATIGRTVELRALPTLQPLARSEQLVGYPVALTFMRDGQSLAVGANYRNDEGVICMLDEKLQLHDQRLGIQGGIIALSYVPGGEGKLAVSGGDRALRIFGLSSTVGDMTLRGHSDFANEVIPSSDGHTLISGSLDGTVRLWDAQSHPAEMQLNFQFPVALGYSPNGQWLVGSGDRLQVHDFATKQTRSVDLPKGEEFSGYFATFTPDSKTLISGYKSIVLWNTADWTVRQSIPIGKVLWAAAVSPDGKQFAVGGQNDVIEIRDLATLEVIRTLHPRGRRVRSLAYTPDGKRLLSSTWDTGSSLQMWDLESAEDRPIYTIDGGATSAVLSPDGKTFAATGRDFSIRIFDAARGEMTSSFLAHTYEIWTLCYSPDGKTLASASWDGTAKLWATSTNSLLMTIRQSGRANMFAAAFSADGKAFATNGGINEEGVKVYFAANAITADEDPEAVRLRADALKKQAKFGEAKTYLQGIVEQYAAKFGADDVRTARVKLGLADLIIDARGQAGNYSEAETLIVAVRKVFGSRLPPGHSLRWAALYSLRNLYSPEAMNDPAKLKTVQALITPPPATKATTGPKM